MTPASTRSTADSTPVTAAPTAVLAEEKVRIRGPLGKLLFWFIPANLFVFLLWGAIPGVLLPLQVAGIDPDNKVSNLAVVSTIGAFAAMLTQPIFGAISDRTRTRLGRRVPYILSGALVGGLVLIALGLSSSILLVTVCWMLVQVSFNVVQGPFSAILPDRVPVSVRGVFAAVVGAMTMIGGLGGAIVASSMAQNIPTAYLVLAGLAVIALTLFVVCNPDGDNRGEPRPPFRLVDFLSTFWVNPVAHPDFFWAFTGRLLLYTGYFSVVGYQLYLLQDYIGLGDQAIAMMPLVSAIGLPAIVLSIMISGPLSDKLGRRKPFVLVSSLLVAIALVIPWVMPTLGGMLAFSVVAGLGFGAFQAVDTALVSQVLPSADAYAKDLGVLNIAATLPQTVAPAIAGVVVLTFGFAGLFPVGILLSVLGALAVIPIRSVR